MGSTVLLAEEPVVPSEVQCNIMIDAGVNSTDFGHSSAGSICIRVQGIDD